MNKKMAGSIPAEKYILLNKILISWIVRHQSPCSEISRDVCTNPITFLVGVWNIVGLRKGTHTYAWVCMYICKCDRYILQIIVYKLSCIGNDTPCENIRLFHVNFMKYNLLVFTAARNKVFCFDNHGRNSSNIRII